MRNVSVGAALACVAILQAGCAMPGSGDDGGKLRVVSDTTAAGFTFPESVGCDAGERVLYVSNFGGTELKPGEKDGKGFISKVSLDGKVIESRYFPAAGETLHKPKGLWIQGSRLWVTDIDVVWIYDTKTRKGRKIDIPGAKFANDPAVRGNVLYVSDNRSDQLFRIEPADFLDANVKPKVTVAVSGKAISPNGVWPARDGSLLMVGFVAPDQPRAIYAMGRDGEVKPISQPIGRLDGVYEMRDGTLLVTDWNTGSLFSWSAKGGQETLASGFKGPADFCVMTQGDGYTAYVPDLVQSHIRILRLAR
jgi:hypothetical protein